MNLLIDEAIAKYKAGMQPRKASVVVITVDGEPIKDEYNALLKDIPILFHPNDVPEVVQRHLDNIELESGRTIEIRIEGKEFTY